jgi:hypothetical protein
MDSSLALPRHTLWSTPWVGQFFKQCLRVSIPQENCPEKRMKATVCYEFGKPLVVEEVDPAPPKANEVKVRILATAICHSDVRSRTGIGRYDG